MTLINNIPMPKLGGEAFMEGAATAQGIFNAMVEARKSKEQIPLIQAQTKEAAANAIKSNMWSQLLQQAGGLSGQTQGDATGGNPSGNPSQDSIMQNMTSDLKPGESHVVTPNEADQINGGSQPNAAPQSSAPNPKAQNLLAALLKIPVTHNMVDGNMITDNPLTGITTTKVGESPTEKGQREVGESGQKKENDVNIDTGKKALENVQDLIKSAGYYKNLLDVLKKNPKLTGVGTAASVKLRMNKDPDAANFNNNALMALSGLARVLSQRGGIGAANLAKAGKPELSQSNEYNVGMVKAGIKNIEDEFENQKNVYEQTTGKKLPYKLPDFEKAVENSAASTGKHHKFNIKTGEFETT